MATSPESPRPRAAKTPAKAAKATKKATKPAAQKAVPTKPAPGAKKSAAKATSKSPPPVAKAKAAGKPKPVAKAPRAKAPAVGKRSTPRTAAKTTAADKAKAASATRSRYWARAQARARKLLRGKEQLLEIAKQGDKVAAKMRSGPMSRLIEQLKAMLRLIRAYANGEYKEMSWESMVLVVAAVVYVVNPLDLIPDFVPVAGYLDDAAVVGFALRIVRDELDEFVAWEKETGRGPKRRSSG